MAIKIVASLSLSLLEGGWIHGALKLGTRHGDLTMQRNFRELGI